MKHYNLFHNFLCNYFMQLCFQSFEAECFIKRPIRDACLYLEETGKRVGPSAPAFSIAYSSATTGRILFKFSTCMQ